MEFNGLLIIAGVMIAGFFCQWIAWKVKIPAIIPLLATGLLAGPVLLDILHPRDALGELFFPFVSLAVSIILFEGALTLNFGELRKIRSVVRNLLVVGAIVSWLGGAIAAHYLMGLSWELSLLFGALIIVTGPTVIAPLLRNVRPTAEISSILKWEGILIDPLGALVAVLVFDYIIAGSGGLEHTVTGFFKITIIGSALGFTSGYVMFMILRHYLVPDYLRDFFIIALVTGTFAVSSSLAEESGLLAVTVMGIFLANTDLRQLREIWYFKEKISILLISTLFILLAANFTPELLGMLDWGAFAVLAIVMLVLRPIGIFLSSMGSTLERNERLFLSWIAPRGIVAAAVSSLFTIELLESGYTEAAILAPLVFLIIAGTVLLQGGTAKWVAKRLGVSEADPQGFLLMGSNDFTVDLGVLLQNEGFVVRVVDSNYENVSTARLRGLEAYHGNILSEFTETDLDLGGIGRLLAMTRNDEANALACKHLEEEFGSSEVYQLPPRPGQAGQEAPSRFQLGRLLFGPGMDYDQIQTWRREGATLKRTQLTEKFGFSDFRAAYRDQCWPLLMYRNPHEVAVATVQNPFEPTAGWTLVSLVMEPDEAESISASEESGQAADNGGTAGEDAVSHMPMDVAALEE